MTHVAASTAPDSVRDDPRAHGRGVRPGRRDCSSRGPPAHGRRRLRPRRRHREAGTGPPGGWLGCRRRDRLRRAPGSSRPARNRRRLGHVGGAPGGRPEARRRGRRIGRRWRTVGPCAPAGWRGVRYVQPPRARVVRARVGWRRRRLVPRRRGHAVVGWHARQSHVGGSGGTRGPCRSHSKPGYTSCGARRASWCPPQRTGPSIRTRKTGTSTHDLHERPGCGPRLFG